MSHEKAFAPTEGKMDETNPALTPKNGETGFYRQVADLLATAR